MVERDQPEAILGIDVSKRKVDVVLLRSEKRKHKACRMTRPLAAWQKKGV